MAYIALGRAPDPPTPTGRTDRGASSYLTPTRKVVESGDATWLRQRYVLDGASIAVIAAGLGCAIVSVRIALAAAAIPLRVGGSRRKLGGLQSEQAVGLVRVRDPPTGQAARSDDRDPSRGAPEQCGVAVRWSRRGPPSGPGKVCGQGRVAPARWRHRRSLASVPVGTRKGVTHHGRERTVREGPSSAAGCPGR